MRDMEPIGYALILIVIVCIIALLCISKRRRTMEKDSITKLSPSTGAGVSSEIVKENTTTSDVMQNTIYEFDSKIVPCRCPFCDGENNRKARICIICGQKLS